MPASDAPTDDLAVMPEGFSPDAHADAVISAAMQAAAVSNGGDPPAATVATADAPQDTPATAPADAAPPADTPADAPQDPPADTPADADPPMSARERFRAKMEADAQKRDRDKSLKAQAARAQELEQEIADLRKRWQDPDALIKTLDSTDPEWYRKHTQRLLGEYGQAQGADGKPAPSQLQGAAPPEVKILRDEIAKLKTELQSVTQQTQQVAGQREAQEYMREVTRELGDADEIKKYGALYQAITGQDFDLAPLAGANWSDFHSTYGRGLTAAENAAILKDDLRDRLDKARQDSAMIDLAKSILGQPQAPAPAPSQPAPPGNRPATHQSPPPRAPAGLPDNMPDGMSPDEWADLVISSMTK